MFESFDDILTVEEVSAILKIGTTQAYKIVRSGTLKAYKEGKIDGVFGTNLTYRTPELLSRPWFNEVDVSKYIAYFIASLNHDLSISEIIDPSVKIHSLLEAHGQLPKNQ